MSSIDIRSRKEIPNTSPVDSGTVSDLSAKGKLTDPVFLETHLKVSKEYIEICERYGCKGLWTKDDVLEKQ